MTQRKLMRGYANRWGCGWSIDIQGEMPHRVGDHFVFLERDQTEAQKKSPLIERA